MRHGALLVSLMVCACKGGGIPIVLHDDDIEAALLVEDAAALLGYDVEWRDDSRGAITLALPRNLVIDHHEANYTGVELLNYPCYRVGVAARHPTVVAHEMVHLLGVEGHRVEGLMEARMNSMVGEELMNEDDWATIDAGVERLQRCVSW